MCREIQRQEREMSTAEVMADKIRFMVAEETKRLGRSKERTGADSAGKPRAVLDTGEPENGPRQDGRGKCHPQDQGGLRGPA